MDVRDRRDAHWFWIHDTLLDEYGPRIGAYGIAVYAALARHAKHENQTTACSLTALATKLHLSRPTIIKTIQQLIAQGLIAKEQQVSPSGDPESNCYVLLSLGSSKGGLLPSKGGLLREQNDSKGQHNNDLYDIGSKGDLLPSKGGLLPGSKGGLLGSKGGLPLLEEDLREKKELERKNPPPLSPSRGSNVLTPEALLELYNTSTPASHPKAKRLSPARRKKAHDYLHIFPDSHFWHLVMEEICQSHFLQHGSHDHPNFRGDFDWLLAKGKDGTENCIKVAEGKYRDVQAVQEGLRPQDRRSAEAIQRVLERTRCAAHPEEIPDGHP